MSASHTSAPFKAFAALQKGGQLVPFEYVPRALGDHDVEVKITHCGICASDLHQVEDGWKMSQYPIVPGHEIIGNVSAVGKAVHEFKIGQRVGVGTMVSSCWTCKKCQRGDQQQCPKGVWTYNKRYEDGNLAFGGYASHIRLEAKWVFEIPEALSSAGAAPLLCAGITTFEPFLLHNITAKHRVGVVGLGGLGHLGVKWAVALGCHTTVVSHSESKRDEAKKLGAHSYVNTHSKEQLTAAAGSVDFLLITANGIDMNYRDLLSLVDSHGVACNVAAPEEPMKIPAFALLMNSISLSGSITGGVESTKKMLAFAAKHKIEADVQIFPIQQANEALKGLKEGKPRFRYVLDITTGFGFEKANAHYENGKLL